MKILFICTHNRCRSILAEAVFNHYGNGLMKAASAGSSPAGRVHPLTLECLQARNISTESLRSKSWDDMEDFDPDLVITVCDQAARESCPVWFGKAMHTHWNLTDPSALTGSDEERITAFNKTIDLLQHRARGMTALLEGGEDRTSLFNAVEHFEDGTV